MLLKIIFHLAVTTAALTPSRLTNPLFAATAENDSNEFLPPMPYKRGRAYTYEPQEGDRYLADFDFVKKNIGPAEFQFE